jgi:hypothetical protein
MVEAGIVIDLQNLNEAAVRAGYQEPSHSALRQIQIERYPQGRDSGLFREAA